MFLMASGTLLCHSSHDVPFGHDPAGGSVMTDTIMVMATMMACGETKMTYKVGRFWLDPNQFTLEMRVRKPEKGESRLLNIV
jgi:hypothetical protein